MIPERIVIGGHDVRITIIEDADSLHRDDCSSNWGMASYSENTIFLKRLPSESMMEENLAHEIKHFLDVNSARKAYLGNFKGLDYELQNMMTDNVFWRFLKDNTNFFEFQGHKETYLSEEDTSQDWMKRRDEIKRKQEEVRDEG